MPLSSLYIITQIFIELCPNQDFESYSLHKVYRGFFSFATFSFMFSLFIKKSKVVKRHTEIYNEC